MNTFDRPKKRFSQNFLQNPHYQKKIVDALHIQTTDTVIEIGPGRGALTESILAFKPANFLTFFNRGTLRERSC